MGGFGQPQQTASPGTSECCCFARRVFLIRLILFSL
jgi:hypothetical protein